LPLWRALAQHLQRPAEALLQGLRLALDAARPGEAGTRRWLVRRRRQPGCRHQGEDCDQDRQHDHPLAGAVERMPVAEGEKRADPPDQHREQQQADRGQEERVTQGGEEACHRGIRLNP
jgi:hypothetical protein